MSLSLVALECLPNTCRTANFLRIAHDFWNSGELEGGIAAAHAAVGEPCAGTGSCEVDARLLLVLLLSQVRRSDQALSVLDHLDGVIEADERLGATISLVRSRVVLAAGNVEKAAELATTALEDAERAGLKAWMPLGNVVLAQAALRQGHLSTATRYAQRLKEDAVFRRGMLPAGQAAWAVIQIVEVKQGPDAAVPLVAQLLAAESAIHQLSVAEPAAMAWIVRLMLGSGQGRAARQAVEIADRLAAGNPRFGSLHAAAAHAAGLYDADPEKLRIAAERHVDLWAKGSAHEDLAMLNPRRTADRSIPVRTLQKAHSYYAQTGSTRDSTRIESRLSQAPFDLDSLIPRQRRREIPELTDIEYTVAQLVAQGCTNVQAAGRLFVSPHTVAFHLRKIFRKLGIESRVQLASTWNELALGQVGGRRHVSAGTSGPQERLVP